MSAGKHRGIDTMIFMNLESELKKKPTEGVVVIDKTLVGDKTLGLVSAVNNYLEKGGYIHNSQEDNEQIHISFSYPLNPTETKNA